jgi:hypothetical protein
MVTNLPYRAIIFYVISYIAVVIITQDIYISQAKNKRFFVENLKRDKLKESYGELGK